MDIVFIAFAVSAVLAPDALGSIIARVYHGFETKLSGLRAPTVRAEREATQDAP